ncbi:unnamed protein product [Dibothriocephalus latus]|uniref:Reverse transcriptase domain-containing protein n=1 Tax=Dibothriocephalus latus TaxID=60516 RepID=A0A3P7LB77_DIBLA|nr:unnamed protein product [Dibothriocephalus latus]
MYVNDCVRELDCDVTMFADEIKISNVIRNAVDEERLQVKPNRLQTWSKDRLLQFNENKCSILRVGRPSSQNPMIYSLNGIQLQGVDPQKELGLWITASLKPLLHCAKVAKSAISALYLVQRAFCAFDKYRNAKVFGTFVRTKLEFVIQGWRLSALF